MYKKALAMLLAGSMVMTSPVVAMAGESEGTAVEVESAAAAESEDTAESAAAAESADTAESAAAAESTDTAESAAEATESTDTAEAEAGTESDEFRALVESMLTKIEKAAADVDLEKKEESLGKEFSEEGTVFALFGKILKDIDERKSAAGEESEDFLKQALDAFNSLEETDEKELDGALEAVLLGLFSDDIEQGIEEAAAGLEIATVVANFVFETAKENKLIAEAVEATGSSLFDMLSDSSEELQDADKDEETTDAAEDDSEKWFEQFEEEVAKVKDYINEQEGPKQAALDLLDLVHEIVDDVHYFVHGHTQETLKKS